MRTIALRRTGNRANLLLGGDREMVMFSGLLATVLVFVVQSWWSAALGILLWCFTLWVLRLMAKSDPWLRSVYLRHLNYKTYYAARATPWAATKKYEYSLYNRWVEGVRQ